MSMNLLLWGMAGFLGTMVIIWGSYFLVDEYRVRRRRARMEKIMQKIRSRSWGSYS